MSRRISTSTAARSCLISMISRFESRQRAMITEQAQIVAYIDSYKLLMIATILVIPLRIVCKKARGAGGTDHGMVVA